MMFHFGDEIYPGLAKLSEECGEVVQVIAKLMATNGKYEHWSGINLNERLIEEIADLSAAIHFVTGELSHDERYLVSERTRDKLNLFRKWHYEQKPVLAEMETK